MTPNHHRSLELQPKHADDELCQPAVAEDHHAVRRHEFDLSRELERSRQRLDENRLDVADGIGHFVAIAGGDGQVLGEAAVPAVDADDRVVAAVVGQAGPAHVAPPADAIDFPDHALARELPRPADRHAGELVTHHAAKAHVPLDDLQVRRADTRLADLDEHLAVAGSRLGVPRPKLDLAVETHREHRLIHSLRRHALSSPSCRAFVSSHPPAASRARRPW